MNQYKVAWTEGGIQSRMHYEIFIPSGSHDPESVALAMARGLKADGFKNVRVVRYESRVTVLQTVVQP